MKRSSVAVVGAVLIAALAAEFTGLAPDERWRPPPKPPSASAALLGPIGRVFASAQWVRVDAAFAAGRPAQAFALAERALELDPGATEGWEILVWFQAIQLASPAREPDGERRRQWLENGLAVAARGEQSAREPAALARLAGDVLFVHADAEPATPWPGGRKALLELAQTHYRRAAELGDTEAHASAEGVARKLAGMGD
ncbi:tetratricopeptide repeat protein [Engelhardtia mirabilis]|uniref:Tetratricopeptide repeat protein n=1 Tax=Engelhardtia mirabilis TaxID=2528011 RepID=A0A518BNU0_9BACT|nr:hypothetical protein Pla133_37540 [Planctomycetes bacterium Pla133]QDV02979.1 hypothetical protein Pla86_37530 [Planctomycetes bacterium Pla86]